MEERSEQFEVQGPEALEVDLTSSNASGLFQALAQRHGEAIASAAGLMSRLFLLRARWAPGLRFAGGLAQASLPAPVGDDVLTNHEQILHVGGGGTTIEDALASCFGEAVERLSQLKRPGDVAKVATASEVSDRLLPGTRRRVTQLCSAAGHDLHTTIDWIEGRCVHTNESCLVPADWCLRAPADGPLRVPGTALSTGVAAGVTFEAAATRAILELIERDAVALWWMGGRRAKAPPVDAASVGMAHEAVNSLRQGNQDRVTWILDLTTDLRVPVIAALSTRPGGDGLACGFSARPTARDAARAAVFEMCQMELGLNIAEARAAAQDDTLLSSADRERLALARDLDTQGCELLQAAGIATNCDIGNDDADSEKTLSTLLGHLASHSIEVVLVDLTRAEFEIPVVAGVAPDLQSMPSQFFTRRLTATISETGGGTRYTNGLTLI